MVHRDIKPTNFLVDDAGDLFLTDLGVVRRLDNTNRLTQTGTLIGTMAYMAPEQREGKATVGPPADVYSLAFSIAELVHDKRRDEPGEGIPGPVGDILRSMLNLYAAQRPTAADARAQLRAAVEVAQTATEMDEPTTAAPVKTEAGEVLAEPFEGYTTMTTRRLLRKLTDLDPASLETVVAYETATRNRYGVLEESGRLLAADATPATPGGEPPSSKGNEPEPKAPTLSAHLTPWQQRAAERMLARVAHQAGNPVDQGATLREALRLAGGKISLPGNWSGTDAIDIKRFGLSRSGWAWFVIPNCLPLHAGTCDELGQSLQRVLELDPKERRQSRPATGDGAFRRLTPATHQNYRSMGQKAAFRSFLTMPQGSTLAASLPTGTGKSLLFQAGTRWLQERATDDETPVVIVIVPTVALAYDHEESIRQEYPGLACKAMVGGDPDLDNTVGKLRRGETAVVFMAPEMLLGKRKAALLRLADAPKDREGLSERGRLAAFFVDEAHIIESWGRTFRPDFQQLPGVVQTLRQKNPALRTVLLSATIGKRAADLFEKDYSKGSLYRAVREERPRREFDLVSHHYKSSAQRNDALLAAVDHLPRPAILYTTKVEHANALRDALRARGYATVAAFTGETQGAERRAMIKQWKKGLLDLVVATSAFGMGVNQSDVRTVVHACLPEDASRYYQEIGRAGRDGHQAYGILLTSDEDINTAVGLALGKSLTLPTAQRRWKNLLATAAGADSLTETVLRIGGTKHQSYDLRWDKSLLVQMQRYGALRVLCADEAEDTWTVKQTEKGGPLFDPETSEAALADLFNARDRDEAGLRQELKDWMASLREGRCLLRTAFRAVEANAPYTPNCGRCSWCRANRRAVPQARALWASETGAGVLWSEPEPCRARNLGLDRDLTDPATWQRIAAAGIQQFVAPDSLVEAVATALASVSNCGNPGMVVSHSDIREHGWALNPVATAVAYAVTTPEKARQTWDVLREQRGRLPLVLWVGSGGAPHWHNASLMFEMCLFPSGLPTDTLNLITRYAHGPS